MYIHVYMHTYTRINLRFNLWYFYMRIYLCVCIHIHDMFICMNVISLCMFYIFKLVFWTRKFVFKKLEKLYCQIYSCTFSNSKKSTFSNSFFEFENLCGQIYSCTFSNSFFSRKILFFPKNAFYNFFSNYSSTYLYACMYVCMYDKRVCACSIYVHSYICIYVHAPTSSFIFISERELPSICTAILIRIIEEKFQVF